MVIKVFNLVAAVLLVSEISFAAKTKVAPKEAKPSAAATQAGPKEIKPYLSQEFLKDQKEGKKILLQYHASWCPTCKRQKHALLDLLKDPDLKKIEFVSADFDTEEALKDKYKVDKQSTLILFDGEKVLKTQGGMTDPMQIKSFILDPAPAAGAR